MSDNNNNQSQGKRSQSESLPLGKRPVGKPPKYITEEERKKARDECVKRSKQKYFAKTLAMARAYKQLQETLVPLLTTISEKV